MGRPFPVRRGLVVGALLLSFASCGDDGDGEEAVEDPEVTAQSSEPAADEPQELWPRPGSPQALARKAGVKVDVIEHLRYHVHAHLDVFVDGQPVVVPPGIGIVIDDPDVHEFSGPLGPGYGGIEPPGCDQPCISLLHTHDPDGVIHTESPTPEGYTLGQFFVEWDVALSTNCVADYCSADTDIAFYIDGELHEGDPTAIELLDRRQITVVIGEPPAEIPASFDFGAV